MMTGTSGGPEVSLSLVSHGHGPLVQQLLHDLRALHWPRESYELLLTFNAPEDTAFVSQFADLSICVTVNPQPLGFGANHNAAFKRARGRAFAVVNPDVRLPMLDLTDWMAGLDRPEVGACAPLAHDSQGQLQDNARRFPTLGSLIKRVLTGKRLPSYNAAEGRQFIDWAAGYFVLFRREAFEQMAGFDEAYFMYMEDVDIGRRLQRKGWKVLWDPSLTIVHDSQRASHRQWRHLRWHVQGAWRYFFGASR